MIHYTVPIDSIKVSGHHRHCMGDMDALVASMQESGLLHPVVLDPDRNLIAGLRRLMAARKLGWVDIPATIVDNLTTALSVLEAQRDENTCREPLTMNEALALGKALEALEKPRAQERQREGGRAGGQASGKFPEASNPGQTRDKVAKTLGMSGRTYEKAKVVAAAAEIAPEKFATVAEEMNGSSNVDRAYQEVKADQETFHQARTVVNPQSSQRKSRKQGEKKLLVKMLRWAAGKRRVTPDDVRKHFEITLPDAQKKLAHASQTTGFLVQALDDGAFAVYRAVHFIWQGEGDNPELAQSLQRIHDMAEKALCLDTSNSSCSWSPEARHMFLVEVLAITEGLLTGQR